MEDRCIHCGEIIVEGEGWSCFRCRKAGEDDKQGMGYAHPPWIMLNRSVEYRVYYVGEDKPSIKVRGRKKVNEFVRSHAEYDIVGMIPRGFYEMEMDIKRRESEGEG